MSTGQTRFIHKHITASKAAADAVGAETFLGMNIKTRMTERGRNGASPIPALVTKPYRGGLAC